MYVRKGNAKLIKFCLKYKHFAMFFMYKNARQSKFCSIRTICLWLMTSSIDKSSSLSCKYHSKCFEKFKFLRKKKSFCAKLLPLMSAT